MTPDPEHPALEDLRARLAEEEAAYAEVLAAIDGLSAFTLPAEAAPQMRERLERLNELWPAPERPAGGGLGGALRRRAWDAVAPALDRQAAFNAALVQLLNAYLTRPTTCTGTCASWPARSCATRSACSRSWTRATGVATALATTRSELLLEAFDRRLESMGRRLAELAAARDAPR